jgi:hypothetical protein
MAAAATAAAGSNNIACDFCNMAVQYIKLALHNNQTIEQIEQVGCCQARGGGGQAGRTTCVAHACLCSDMTLSSFASSLTC